MAQAFLVDSYFDGIIDVFLFVLQIYSAWHLAHLTPGLTGRPFGVKPWQLIWNQFSVLHHRVARQTIYNNNKKKHIPEQHLSRKWGTDNDADLDLQIIIFFFF